RLSLHVCIITVPLYTVISVYTVITEHTAEMLPPGHAATCTTKYANEPTKSLEITQTFTTSLHIAPDSEYTSRIGLTMRFPRALPVAVLLLSLLPTSAQDGTQPYFSLSSSKTFAPGEKATISMWSQNVDTLEFRVYRVKDPILFFQKLED